MRQQTGPRPELGNTFQEGLERPVSEMGRVRLAARFAHLPVSCEASLKPSYLPRFGTRKTMPVEERCKPSSYFCLPLPRGSRLRA